MRREPDAAQEAADVDRKNRDDLANQAGDLLIGQNVDRPPRDKNQVEEPDQRRGHHTRDPIVADGDYRRAQERARADAIPSAPEVNQIPDLAIERTQSPPPTRSECRARSK